MSDPRIVRGNTYAPVPTKSKVEFKPAQQTQKRPPPIKNVKSMNVKYLSFRGLDLIWASKCRHPEQLMEDSTSRLKLKRLWRH